MSVITLKEAKEHLQAWRKADLAVSTGQSYRMGTRQLQRADVAEIRENIKYWEKRVKELEGKRKRKAFGIVPRDF